MEDIKHDLGKFYVESTLKDGEGIRILKRFLLDTIMEIAKESAKFIQKVEHSPYAYGERQLHTVIAPAIARNADCFIMESPVDRKWSSIEESLGEDSRGWVDYWCVYKDFNYYIELKKGYVSYASKNLTQQVKEEWKQACNQLDAIQEDIAAQESIARKVFRVAVEVLTVYLKSKDREKLSYELEGFLQVQENAIKQLSETRPVNWSCLWVLDDKLMANSEEEYKNGVEIYPAVLFLMRIS